MPISMGMQYGLGKDTHCHIRKNRWLLRIPNISADGIPSLPPNRSARPKLTFKMVEMTHVTETVKYPMRPDWASLNLTLYDLKDTMKNGRNPIFEWLRIMYDPENGLFAPAGDGAIQDQAVLELYDGCGNTIERWIYENVTIESLDFQDLDMSSSDVVMCDLTLNYHRAYIQTLLPEAAPLEPFVRAGL